MEDKAAVELLNLLASSGSVGAMMFALYTWMKTRFDRVDHELAGHKKDTGERFGRVEQRLEVIEQRDREHSRRLARIELSAEAPSQSMRGRVVERST